MATTFKFTTPIILGIISLADVIAGWLQNQI